MKRNLFSILFGFLALQLPNFSHAQVQTIVVKGNAGPIASSQYRQFERRPAAGGELAGNAVAFAGKLKLLGGSIRGVFSEDPINPGIVEGSQISVIPGTQGFKRFRRPSMNTVGEVTWVAGLGGAGRGVFLSGPQLVSLVGDPIPTGGVLNRFARPVIADAGDVVFHATISGGASEGIFRCSGGDRNCSTGTALWKH